MNFDLLTQQIGNVQDAIQASTAHAINLGLTARNWLFGYYITEFEQKGEDRAAYGEKLLANLEKKLNCKGLTERRFREFRRFYLVYPQLGPVLLKSIPPDVIKIVITPELESRFKFTAIPELTGMNSAPANTASSETIRHSLSAEFKGLSSDLIINKIPYTNLKQLLFIDDPLKRAFYEIESIRACWSSRELERQISTLYFERSGLSKNKKALSAMVNRQAHTLIPNDIINTPITLEFLGLNERALVTESDLEQAILDHLQYFLLEMGNGFCFEARPKRMLIDDDYFFCDLVFYHRILKCHVLVDLKVDKFKSKHASQLNMYLNFYKYEVMTPDDNPPIGILLCTEKGTTQVEYATAGMDENLFVQKYLVQLPDKREIEEYLTRELKAESILNFKM